MLQFLMTASKGSEKPQVALAIKKYSLWGDGEDSIVQVLLMFLCVNQGFQTYLTRWATTSSYVGRMHTAYDQVVFRHNIPVMCMLFFSNTLCYEFFSFLTLSRLIESIYAPCHRCFHVIQSSI